WLSGRDGEGPVAGVAHHRVGAVDANADRVVVRRCYVGWDSPGERTLSVRADRGRRRNHLHRRPVAYEMDGDGRPVGVRVVPLNLYRAAASEGLAAIRKGQGD